MLGGGGLFPLRMAGGHPCHLGQAWFDRLLSRGSINGRATVSEGTRTMVM